MEETITKPSFREEGNLMVLDDVGLQFNVQRVGPTNFSGLRKADYGLGSRMPTMPEIVSLVYASLESQDYETAKDVIKTLRSNWLTGNTGILYVPEGMLYVQDNPELRDNRVFMGAKTLESTLGSHEESGVIFSDDRSIRFTPYNFKRASQTPLELSTNQGVVALVGGEENAEKIAKASEHYKLDPRFYALSNVKLPEIRVAGLGSGDFDYGLFVGASDGEGFGDGCSFGVRESGEATHVGK